MSLCIFQKIKTVTVMQKSTLFSFPQVKFPCDTNSIDFKRKIVALFVAVISVVVFFYPSFYGKGTQVGFAYFHDTWHLIIAQAYLSGFYGAHGVFSGIDLFTHGGASEFFLRPNLPVYHPIILLADVLFRKSSPEIHALLYVWILTIHAFVGMYFIQRLCTSFFRFSSAIAAFVAIFYIFSMQSVYALCYFPYNFVAWIFPAALYMNIIAAKKKKIAIYLLASIPSFIIFLGGYAPMAVMAIAMATAMAAFIVFHSMDKECSLKKRIKESLLVAIPVILSSIIVAPLYVAINEYFKTTEIFSRAEEAKVYAIAFRYSEVPMRLFRFVAANLIYDGPLNENCFFMGLVPIFIVILYVAQYKSKESFGSRLAFHRNLLSVSLVVYAVFFLIVFGQPTVLSDAFYYFVPIAGKMHIYQRFLLLSQLFFAISIGIMLSRIVRHKNKKIAKILLLLVFLLLIIVAHAVGNYKSVGIVIREGLVIELLYLFIFIFTLIIARPASTVVMAIFLVFFVSLGAMYRFADTEKNHLDKILSQQVTYSPTTTNALIQYFQTNSDKAMTKVINLLPSPQTYVPRNFPWFTAYKMKLSMYYGYDWHLSTNNSYRQLMKAIYVKGDPDLVMRPDWEWLRKTGAQFAIFEENRKSNDPALSKYVDLCNPTKVYRMTSGDKVYIVAPLKFPERENVVFDNGYIRVINTDKSTKVTSFTTNDAGDLKFHISSTQPSTVEYLFWPNQKMHARIDNVKAHFSMSDGLSSLHIPTGDHSIRFFYRSLLLDVFLAFYVLYGLVLFVALLDLIACYRLSYFIGQKISRLKCIQR